MSPCCARQGVAARARCGFGAYFEKGKFIDHWVTEYWNESQQRWVLVDAQLDQRQRELFGIAFDPLDVPRDQFLVAGDAWQLCRGGKADPGAFGILDMHGSVVHRRQRHPRRGRAQQSRDAAVGRLGCDDPERRRDSTCRSSTSSPSFSHAPDRHFGDLRAAYKDKRVAVPGTVFNAVLNRPDPVP